MIGLNSCKKDSTSAKNEVTYLGTSFDLTKGYIAKPSVAKVALNYYNFDVFLTSSTLTLTYDFNLSGTGNFLGFTMHSTSPTDLVAGTYTYNADAGDNTFSYGEAMCGSTYATKSTSLPVTTIVGGTIKVAISGTDYELTFNGTLSDESTITAYFKGPLTEIPNHAPVTK